MDVKNNKIMREHMRERFGVVNNFVSNPPLPASLNIELNNTCNQRCIFCPYHGKFALNEPTPAILNIDFVEKILDSAKKLGIGSKEVGFYLAGEPLIYKQLSDVIRSAKNKGFGYTFITTNGALATKERIDELISAGLDSIRFSVNGGDRDTYKEIHQKDDFDKVVDNIVYLNRIRKEEGIDIAVSLSCVVTKRNKDSIENIKQLFASYVDDILFIPIIFTGLKNIDSIKDEYQIVDDTNIDSSYICPMLFDTMYINAFGRVVPCCDAYHGNVEFYDLNENFDMIEAWNSRGYRRYRDIFLNNGSDYGTICRQCVLRRKGVNRLSFNERFV